jgi:drug/metabolite transporter (DMT)-like permease
MELKHGYYHLIAILVVAIWGLTFISTKVLINHGLTPQEIFFYRFLIAYLWHLGDFPQTSVYE